MRQPVRRFGFTLIELLIVIAVIAALAAMGFPIWGKIRRDAEINGTKALVQAVALAITSYERKDWAYLTTPTLTTPSVTFTREPRICSLWDLNGDHVIDANPSLDDKLWLTTVPLLPQAHPAWTNNGNTVTDYASTDLPFRIQNLAKNSSNLWIMSGGSYVGFYDMTNINVASRFVHKATHQLRDAWGEPLRIAFAANTYGTVWFGVWSAGPDKISAPDATVTDDITSWK